MRGHGWVDKMDEKGDKVKCAVGWVDEWPQQTGVMEMIVCEGAASCFPSTQVL